MSGIWGIYMVFTVWCIWPCQDLYTVHSTWCLVCLHSLLGEVQEQILQIVLSVWCTCTRTVCGHAHPDVHTCNVQGACVQC